MGGGVLDENRNWLQCWSSVTWYDVRILFKNSTDKDFDVVPVSMFDLVGTNGAIADMYDVAGSLRKLSGSHVSDHIPLSLTISVNSGHALNVAAASTVTSF